MAIRRRGTDLKDMEPAERLRRLKQVQFPPRGREKRIARALEALDSAVVDYGLDAETVKRIVEDVDLEDI
jgi:hypothetical protein